MTLVEEIREKALQVKQDFDDIKQAGVQEGLQAEYVLTNGFKDYFYFYASLISRQTSETEFENIIPPKMISSVECTALRMFRGYNVDAKTQQGLNMINAPMMDTSKVTSFQNAFEGCLKLKKVPQYDLSNAKNFSYMFYNCKALESVDFTDYPSASNLNGMYGNCESLGEITITAPLCTKCSGLFQGCKLLTNVTLAIPNATVATNMFKGCTSLTNLTFIDWIKCDHLNISDCTNLTHESLMSTLNHLYDYSSSNNHILEAGANNLEKLSEEEKNIARNKGWTLA